VEWNSSERRKGVDGWPEAHATVTSIEQPFTNRDFAFLSVIQFTFKDNSGEYFAGKYQMRTSDLPEDLMTGSTISIRYNPKNPNKNWCADDYFRAGFGRWQAYGFPIFLLSILLLVLLLTGIAMLIRSR
jgi:Protein of unknown function (DUF3592)